MLFVQRDNEILLWWLYLFLWSSYWFVGLWKLC